MNLLSINDLDKTTILDLFSQADKFRLGNQQEVKFNAKNIIGLLFFEPSTRTRIGFEAATWKLGYKSIVLDETKPSVSEGWSESMSDTIRTMNAFVNAYFIRHSNAKIFEEVIPFTTSPVINCGNGYDEHPTQALIDAYAMWIKFGKLDGLMLTFIGDTKYSRAAHSLSLLLGKFPNVKLNEIVPSSLRLPAEYVKGLAQPKLMTKSDLGNEQILYSSGFPPINPSGIFSQEIVQQYVIHKEDAMKLAKECIIMNPLPRIDEIDSEVDSLSNAYYFKQNELGLYMRMAIVKQFFKQ